MQENNKEIFSINKRIIEFIEYLNISRYKFSKETNISEANLLNIYKGVNKPSVDFIEKILNKYKVLNPTWLLTGEGPMLREAGAVQAHGNQPAIASAPKHEATASPSCAQCAVKDKIIASQEATIEAQKATIESQKETIMLLKKDLEACGRSKKPPLPDTLPDEVTAKLKKD